MLIRRGDPSYVPPHTYAALLIAALCCSGTRDEFHRTESYDAGTSCQSPHHKRIQSAFSVLHSQISPPLPFALVPVACYALHHTCRVHNVTVAPRLPSFLKDRALWLVTEEGTHMVREANLPTIAGFPLNFCCSSIVVDGFCCYIGGHGRSHCANHVTYSWDTRARRLNHLHPVLAQAIQQLSLDAACRGGSDREGT